MVLGYITVYIIDAMNLPRCCYPVPNKYELRVYIWGIGPFRSSPNDPLMRCFGSVPGGYEASLNWKKTFAFLTAKWTEKNDSCISSSASPMYSTFGWTTPFYQMFSTQTYMFDELLTIMNLIIYFFTLLWCINFICHCGEKIFKKPKTKWMLTYKCVVSKVMF